MSKTVRKIIAIGGGENGRINSKGEKLPYELSEIDSEIIRLTGRKKPRVLFLAHAQISFGFENELRYYETIKKIYGDMFGCDFRWLKASELTDNFEKAQNDVSWADIIYEGGGNTVAMIELWEKTGFDNLLRDAWKTGKVMCGVSAGAICWFALGNTDVPGYKDAEVNQIPGLGFIDAYFSPHCNKEGKRESEINSLKHIDKVGLSVSNCSAIEIIDDQYRVIKSTPADGSFRPYVLRTYWKNGNMFEEEISETADFKKLDLLLSMKD
jgi:dipeptidase E